MRAAGKPGPGSDEASRSDLRPSTQVVDPPRTADTGRPLHEAGSGVAVATAAAALAWFRLTAGARDTMWAEDGPVMVSGALDKAFPDAVLEPYAGYLHALPRTLADLLVAAVPPQRWAVAVTAMSCLVTGLVAALVHRCAADLVESRWARVALASLTVAVPVLPLEVLGNFANLHWLMLWATPWLLIARPRGRVDTAVLALAALVIGLTEIQSVLFLPILLWRWRDRSRLPVRGVWLAAVAAQLVTAATTARDVNGLPPPGFVPTLISWANGSVLTLWTGSGRGLHAATAVMGPAAVVPALLLVTAACLLVARRGDQMQRMWAVGALVASPVLYVVAVQTNSPELMVGDALAITRYAVVPSMLVASVVVLGVALVPHAQAWRVATAALVAPALAAAVIGWQPVVTARNEGPSWSQQVVDGQRACRAEPTNGPVVVTLAPEGWWVGMDCEDVVP